MRWSYTWRLPFDDNASLYALMARATDDSGATGTSADMPTVRIDNRPPTVVAFYIEDDAAYVAQVDVTLQLNAVDGSPPVQVQLSNDGTSWSAWQALAPSVPWTLATGDGPKEVWARLRDSRGTPRPPRSKTPSSFLRPHLR